MSNRLGTQSSDSGQTAQRWWISYAGLMTVLLSLFVVLYATRKETKTEVKEVVATPVPGSPAAHEKEREQQKVQFTEDFQTALGAFGTDAASTPENTQVMKDEQGILIRLTAPNLFDEGKMIPPEEVRPLLNQVGKVLAGLPHEIRIEGYADPREPLPDHVASAWDLSTARAAWVARDWISRFQIAPGRITVSGHGSFRPLTKIDAKSTAWDLARERRIEVLVVIP